MTDFVPASSLSGFPQSTAAATFWAAASFGSRVANDAEPVAPGASAASLAASVHELLAAITARRVPRIAAIRSGLQQARAERELSDLEQALKAVQGSAAALDFLHAREAGDRGAEFVRQAKAATCDIQRLWAAGAAFFQRQAACASSMRLLCGELKPESRSIERRVRQGMDWLAAMEQDLALRRATSTATVAHRALEELERRGRVLRERLQLVGHLSSHAQGALASAEQLAAGHAVFADTLKGKVGPATNRLHAGLHPLAEGGSDSRLEPARLLPLIDAHHELQVALTQAGADILRLQACDHELAAHLAWMAQQGQRIA